MPRLSGVEDAFLDGFGCLGALFVPVIRPGSMDNLIQSDPSVLDDSTVTGPPERLRIQESGHIKGFLIHAAAGILMIGIIGTVLGSTRLLGWLPHPVEAISISILTLVLSEGSSLLGRLKMPHPRESKPPHGI